MSAVTGLSQGVNGGSVVEQWTQTRQTDQEHEVGTWCSLHIVCFTSQTSNHVKAFKIYIVEGAILYKMLLQLQRNSIMWSITSRLPLLIIRQGEY